MRRFRSLPGRASAPLGSVLLGSPDEELGAQRRRVQVMTTVLILLTNIVGAAVVTVLLWAVIPGPNILEARFAVVNFVVVPAYVGAAFLVGGIIATRIGLHELNWVIVGRLPTSAEQRAALSLPWRLTAVQAGLWFGAAVVVTTAVGFVDMRACPKVAFTIAFGGATVCTFSYVLGEFALRPVAARAIEYGGFTRTHYAGITSRTVIMWFLGTAVPVVGLMIVGAFSFFQNTPALQLGTSIVALGAIAIISGALLTKLGMRATADPIMAVVSAMAAVERGEEYEHVVVYDGTEVGQLQNGFNRMVDGIAERERIRDLFGRHVGHEVAEAALKRNPGLGGVELQVAVFFIDIIGSTNIASSRPPQEVVSILNRFFGVVVDEVDKHGGFINKFEGDGALAIFGAPLELDDPPGSALAATRAITKRLPDELTDCRAAVGIAYGTAVAGNIGARKRFEYTVIGDPVNEAARLCDYAKTVPSLVCASQQTVEVAEKDEATHWVVAGEVHLRGRAAATVVMMPID